MAELAPAILPPHQFDEVRVGRPRAFGNLTAVPLFGDRTGPDADLLDEAIPAERTIVTEVSDEGVVGHLLVTHRGVRPLLLLAGEHVLGARQNRAWNASFVVPPGQAIVPVSCVERGRWHYDRDRTPGRRDVTRTFVAPSVTLPGRVRSNSVHRMTRSSIIGLGYDTRQRDVWDDVGEHLEQARAISPTQSCIDAYQQRRAEIETIIRELTQERGQTGLAVFHGARLISMDLFGSESLYQRCWMKIARGLASERYPESQTAAPPMQLCRSILSAIAGARDLCSQSLDGCGPTLHGLVDGYAFLAALHDGQIYHVMVSST